MNPKDLKERFYSREKAANVCVTMDAVRYMPQSGNPWSVFNDEFMKLQELYDFMESGKSVIGVVIPLSMACIDGDENLYYDFHVSSVFVIKGKTFISNPMGHVICVEEYMNDLEIASKRASSGYRGGAWY